MIDHTGIGAAFVAGSAAFCDAALGALRLRRVMQFPLADGADGIGCSSITRSLGSTWPSARRASAAQHAPAPGAVYAGIADG
jgi:hypothetical protein